MIDDPFKISIIDAALSIRIHRQEYPDCTVHDAVRQLKQSTASIASLDYNRAAELVDRIGWGAFSINGARDMQLRSALRSMINALRPLWANAAAWGRERMLAIATQDLRQCLRYAGLLENPLSDDAANWWAEIIASARSFEKSLKLANGRRGELLTIAHEKVRLASEEIPREPIWVALDNEGAGYDVLSYQRNEEGIVQELMIEVKASAFLPLHFFLTRHEWEAATKSSEQFLFHIWDLESEQLRLFTTAEMSHHIPTDQGDGKWVQVRIQVD